MEIRVLGPLEAWQGSTRLSLGAPKQQAVLVQLAIRVGEAISAETLIDALWPEDPPRSAAKSVQVYVSNLRRILPPGSITTRGHAYELTIEPSRIDAIRFERLLATARREIAAARIDVAAAALRDGLALWRGPALEGFRDEGFVAPAAAALDELRLEAWELALGVAIDSGRGPEVLAQVENLVRDHPLREPVRALLMRALYQAGRQADALAAYQEARRVLDDELGLDPSPELQRLERSILLQDRALLGSPERRPREPASAAERKLATVLVAMPAGLPVEDPERAIAMLDRFGRVLVDEIERAGGTADRLATGAIRGTFGVPVAHEDHATRAIEAAVRARQRLGFGPGGRPPIRMGVETGDVVFGSPGGETIVIGTAVDRATRLAELAGAGEVLAGRRAVALASRFSFSEPDDAMPGDDVAGHRVLVGEASPGVDVGGAGSPFVGRRRELIELKSRYRRTLDEGRPSLVVLVGDPGIGKTRLVDVAARRRSAEDRRARQLTGRCVSYGDAPTYRPLSDMLRSHLGLSEADSSVEILRRLGDRSILGLAFGIGIETDAHPLAVQQRLHDAWVELVAELVAESPVVLTFEDLHWAEQPLLELIARLVTDISGPLFIVATARPEFADRWDSWGASKDRQAALWLEPLAAPEAARLAGLHLTGSGAAAIRSQLLERAEGNPFFIEELVNLHRLTSGPRSVAAPEIPDTIQATIAARIDRLPNAAKASLQVASVIGREFSRGAVRSVLSSMASAASEPALDVLVERDFVRSDTRSSGSDESTYTFKHALTRDVAYGSLPAGRRGLVHAAVGEWLLGHGGGRDEDAALLAHHFVTAASAAAGPISPDGDEADSRMRVLEQATRWLYRAARLAIGRYELDSAERLLRDAIALARGREDRARIWRALADIGFLRYDGEGFWTAMSQALTLTDGRSERAEVYSVLAEVTAIRRGMWRKQPGQGLLDTWIEQALLLAAEGSASRARALVARAWTAPVYAATRARDLSEASALVAGLDDAPLRSHVLGEQAREAMVHVQFGAALDIVRRHLALCDELDNPDEQALILQQAVANLLSCGRLQEAAEAAARLEQVAFRLSPHHRVHAISAEASVRNVREPGNAVLELIPAIRDRMADSADTPCVSGPWSILVAAAAAMRAGNPALSRELVAESEVSRMEGYDQEFGAQRIQIAILGRDLTSLRALMTMPLRDRWNGWFLSGSLLPYLDALPTLGDPARVIEDAVPFIGSGSLFEPFARRAMAVAGEDDRGIEAAQDQLLALGLTTAASETALLRELFAGRSAVPTT